MLSNHAHFLFRSGSVGLSGLMQRLLTGYVVSFNRRHHRHGQLFQNRYKSTKTQYSKKVVRKSGRMPEGYFATGVTVTWALRRQRLQRNW
ncbi:uncharacterized protein Dvar_83280 [Desulfosarcina variabilis str. Montpellier]